MVIKRYAALDKEDARVIRAALRAYGITAHVRVGHGSLRHTVLVRTAAPDAGVVEVVGRLGYECMDYFTFSPTSYNYVFGRLE